MFNIHVRTHNQNMFPCARACYTNLAFVSEIIRICVTRINVSDSSGNNKLHYCKKRCNIYVMVRIFRRLADAVGFLLYERAIFMIYRLHQ